MNYNTTNKKKCKIKNKENQNLSNMMITAAIFFIMFAILTNPAYYATSVTNGLKLFVIAVLPGLLPFMFLTKIIANLKSNKRFLLFEKSTKKIFGLNADSLYSFFISIISGYPVGSKFVSERYNAGKISDKDINKYAILCSTSGPIFIIGTVGVFMLNNLSYGVVLYVLNIISTIISVIFINIVCQIKQRNKTTVKFDEINSLNNSMQLNKTSNNSTPLKNTKILSVISRAATDTASSLTVVAFYIAFFFMFIDLLTNLKIISGLAYIFSKNCNNSLLTGLFSGLVEMTRGIQILSETKSVISLSAISFLLSFSGLSIIFQSLSFLQTTTLKTKKFIFGKIFQGIISFVLSTIVFSVIL